MENVTKKWVKIDGCDMGLLAPGSRAEILVGDKYYRTSPVVNAWVANGMVCIETRNSIYANF